MKKYIGCEPVDIKQTPFADYTPQDWALYFIGQYGGYDGAHHKDWVLDQVARVLNGTPLKIEIARWSDGSEELRVNTAEPSNEYLAWMESLEDEGYSVGVSP